MKTTTANLLKTAFAKEFSAFSVKTFSACNGKGIAITYPNETAAILEITEYKGEMNFSFYSGEYIFELVGKHLSYELGECGEQGEMVINPTAENIAKNVFELYTRIESM
jgi:hypothetical protein